MDQLLPSSRNHLIYDYPKRLGAGAAEDTMNKRNLRLEKMKIWVAVWVCCDELWFNTIKSRDMMQRKSMAVQRWNTPVL